MNNFHCYNNQEGFSLPEVLVSIFILLVGIVPIVGLIVHTLNDLQEVKNSVIAANLAQEGVEIVRYIRDTNWINNRLYDFEISIGTFCSGYNDTKLESCVPDNRLCRDANGFYNRDCTSSGVQTTPFRRTINIQFVNNPEVPDPDPPGTAVIAVQSTVTWPGNIGGITAATQLYPWK